MKLTPFDGEEITEDGAYEMPMEVYHSQCCDGPSISSGGLRTIWNQSPAHFWAFSDLNRNRFEKPESKALNMGRAAHALLLGDEDFAANYAVIPDNAPQRPTEAMLNAKSPSESSIARINWWAQFDADTEGKTLITEEEYRAISYMAENLHRQPIISDYGLFQGLAEASLIWRFRNVWIKSRPDMLPQSGMEIADLKTIAEADRRSCLRAITDHGYDMQMALAIEGAKIIAGLEIKEAVIVFVEKKPPFTVRCIPLDQDALFYARTKNAIAMRRFAECVESGIWPGPEDDMTPYAAPQWEIDKIDRWKADNHEEAAEVASA